MLVCRMAVLLGSWMIGKQENTVLVPSKTCSRREHVPGWRSIFPRGLWDVGTLAVKSRCGAALASAPAQQGEPGADPGSKWCSTITHTG